MLPKPPKHDRSQIDSSHYYSNTNSCMIVTTTTKVSAAILWQDDHYHCGSGCGSIIRNRTTTGSPNCCCTIPWRMRRRRRRDHDSKQQLPFLPVLWLSPPSPLLVRSFWIFLLLLLSVFVTVSSSLSNLPRFRVVEAWTTSITTTRPSRRRQCCIDPSSMRLVRYQPPHHHFDPHPNYQHEHHHHHDSHENDVTNQPTTTLLTRPQRKALERAKKLQQQSRGGRRQSSSTSVTTANLLLYQNTTNTTTTTTNTMLDTKRLRRTLQQIQTTRNAHALRQIVATLLPSNGTTLSWSSTTTATTPEEEEEHHAELWTRLVVTAMYCCGSDDDTAQLWRDTLLPKWKQMTRKKDADTVWMIRSLLFVPPTPVQNRIPPPDQEAWNILHSELSPLVTTTTTTSSSLCDDENATEHTDTFQQPPTRVVSEQQQHRYLYRAKALLLLATWYFVQNEPLLAIQTCHLLEQTGSWLLRITTTTPGSTGSTTNRHQNDITSPPPTQLSWIRLLQEASLCQSRMRQNNCTSLVVPPNNTSRSIPLWSNDNDRSSSLPSDLPSNVVYSVLSARCAFPKQYNDYGNHNSDRIYELISNALVRRVVFVTGAVSMAGCPRHDTAEVCFIGRSNVGKSSLINMVFNRKALAYTSKRPGKTQQFNFFTVNDIPDKEKEIKYGDDIAGRTGKTKDDDSFYIVDLPGFGYAKVPEAQKQKWMTFMYEYLMTRSNLRIVFHLIDSRHGPMADDHIIMQQMALTLQNRVQDPIQYVIVLTKADKNVKGKASSSSSNESSSNKASSSSSSPQRSSTNNSAGKVSAAVAMAVRRTMEECGIQHCPILLTSAETKLGRDDIWKYLQIATTTTKRPPKKSRETF